MDNRFTLQNILKNVRRFFSVNWLKSFYVNVYYLGIRKAFHFPILLGYGVKVSSLGERNAISVPQKFASICFALKADPFNMGHRNSYWHISKGARAVFSGSFRVSKGTVFHLFQGAIFKVGDGFSANANLVISCAKEISVGHSCLLGWNITIMDSDGGHTVLDASSGVPLVGANPIRIGNRVWIGAEASILKGTELGDGSVVGLKSNLCGKKFCENVIVGGNPAKELKRGYTWKG